MSTKPVVNEVVDATTLTKRLEKRVRELEAELEQNRTTVPKQQLFKEMLLVQRSSVSEAEKVNCAETSGCLRQTLLFVSVGIQGPF